MQPLVYVDTSEVREGALGQLREAIGALAGFVEQNEPRLVSYSVYFSEDGRRMTVVHVHADAASLDHHMEVAGPRFAAFADLVRLSSIHIYGTRARRRSDSCVTRCGCSALVMWSFTARTPGSPGSGSLRGGRPLSTDTAQRRRRPVPGFARSARPSWSRAWTRNAC
jgi:hypothetical protein